MKTIILSSLAALAVAGATPVTAQPHNAPYSRSGGWDRDAFWRGAPNSVMERITFVQRRLNNGIADGTLDRREARQTQRALDDIRRDAQRMGRLDRRERTILQDRLDDVSRQLNWHRRDVAYGGGYRANPDRFRTQYDAARYYRDDRRYTERRLSDQDEVYRGSDGRYYCKRSDGTTGLIIGAAGGALLGNVVDGGRNRTAGTLIGGALGAILGKSIEQNNDDVRCR